jgi:hypothetical protein
MRHRPFIIAALLAVALVVTAAPAFAQLAPPQQPRPTRALFGAGTSTNTSQHLTLNASFGAGYDDDRLTTTPVANPLLPPPPPPRSGGFGNGSANLSYGLNHRSVSAGLAAGAHGRYYEGLNQPLVGTYSVSGNLAVHIGTRTTLSTSHQVGLYLSNIGFLSNDPLGTGSQTVPVDPTTFANVSTYSSMRSEVQAAYSLTQRWSVGAGYSYYTNDLWTSTTSRYASTGGSVSTSFALTRGLSLRAGYSFTGAAGGLVAGSSSYRGRSFDGGVAFNRALSLSRRSTLAFSTGLSGVTDPNGSTRFYLTGNATFGYEIGRSWSVSASYARSADFYQAVGQPVLLDTAGVGIGGLIGRRVQLSVNTGLVKGKALSSLIQSDYMAVNSGVRLQVALTRQLAVGAGYSYYIHEFDDSTPLPPGVLSSLERQSVRVSLNVWVPILSRARRN